MGHGEKERLERKYPIFCWGCKRGDQLAPRENVGMPCRGPNSPQRRGGQHVGTGRETERHRKDRVGLRRSGQRKGRKKDGNRKEGNPSSKQYGRCG